MAHNYLLQVTAGSTYELSSHQVVPVNSPTPTSIESEHLKADLNVRIQSYRGLPHSSPVTSPYFSHPPHAQNQDQYSITFTFTPKHPISGNDLVFGNDLDHPVRDRLPPGLNTAFKIAKWFVDPGLDGDFYADSPYLYSPLGSGLNVMCIHGENEKKAKDGDKEGQGSIQVHKDMGLLIGEGGDAQGLEMRRSKGVPDTEAGRKKHFLSEAARKEWVWEEGVKYGCDFFNPYLDFNEFALRLPGFTLHIMSYWDGQPLRYVLKDRSSDTELLVIQFTLYLKEDVDEHGNIKEGVAAGLPFGKMGEEERQRHMEARKDLPNQEVGNNEKEGGEEDEDKDVEREEQRKKEARRDSGNGTAVSRAFGDDEGVD